MEEYFFSEKNVGDLTKQLILNLELGQDQLNKDVVFKCKNIITKQMKNTFSITAQYRARIIDPDTQAIEHDQSVHNLVTDVGLTHVLNRWTNANAVSALGYLAVGTGTAAPGGTDTTLTTELTRKSMTWSVNGAIATGSVLFNTSEANGTLTEVGLVDSISGSTIKTHALFPAAIAKTATKMLLVDVTITVARAS